MFKIQPRQSIHTRFLPHTETKPARVKAVTGSGVKSVTVSWDDGLTIEENHERVAVELCAAMGWNSQTDWVGSSSQDGRGFTFVNIKE